MCSVLRWGGEVGQLLWQVRRSDLSLNKDDLSGSESRPGGVKVSVGNLNDQVWNLFPFDVPGPIDTFPRAYSENNVWRRNTEPGIIAELLCKTVCSDAMRRVLPNLILSYITSSPRGKGKVSLLVLCRSVHCRLLFWITQNSFSLWSAR